ncbi:MULTISPECIES: flagellar assembly protein FliH [Treponema]|uniref:Flagellar assembly protein FliH n=1 Tax=Treponema porcinum TaxID=261392 RepID=A0A1T4KXR0_TREPO|nr:MULTISPECIES: flagellar assembly protein FliH [Treponema]MCI5645274.1 flagellar assembly protein FliH [Treponema porcinum]MCI6480743.1 flagellar assembly protein FliH [Treponema porcinum]MDD7126332.1 flagellar assembly protein FliH [Treponema porcinum]MDY4189240.1 flagellar assembly protein FliH [Treponema porcinum]MDY4468061.1 flagellar assembly protein FliH [Treponema porcinum]
MAKTVFRPNEIKTKSGDKVTLKLIHDYTPEKVEEVAEVEEYIGPTADDLRKEAEAFKAGWEIEKKRMLDEAQKSADEIVKKAEDAAFAEVKRQTDQAQVIKADAEKEAQDIVNKAQAEAQEIIAKAHSEENEIRDSAYRKGYDEGQKSGYNDGQSELNRLIERVHKIVESVMNRREEILRDTEQQIVDLVILMTRKIVKIISENQKGVVLSNVLSALKKVKTRCSVIIRVNIEDLKLTSEHTGEFIKRVEAVQGITVIEDSSVDKGGCVVETDFGAIDARIASQLGELENKILEISPVKTVEAKKETAASEKM